MVAPVQSQQRSYTPEEYLTWERQAESKNEYSSGKIYAMSGGSPEHSLITVNLTREISVQLKGRTCRAFSNDMKVRSVAGDFYYYPDLTVVCGEPLYYDDRRDVLINPNAIFEILSPSTEGFDRGKKFAQYQTIQSFSDYLLIAQDEPRIDHFMRDADGRWFYRTTAGLHSSVAVASIDCTLILSEIYDRIEF